jgi:nucleotide-binding universal stress UspA family protein
MPLDLHQGGLRPTPYIVRNVARTGRESEEKTMGYKEILVTVGTGPAGSERLDLAAALAERFEAHLIGLHTALTPLAPAAGGYFERFDRSLLDPLYREFSEGLVEREQTARSLFSEVAAKRRLAAEWRTSAGYPSEDAALHGRYVDLVILGQTDPDNIEEALVSPSPEEVALAVGRPVLVVPYAGQFQECGRRVLVAWNASRAATRAINDAMPLLAGAEAVTVLSVDPTEDGRAHGDVPGMDIAVHLARHGVKADVESTASGGIGVGNALLSRASDIGADLLVMGAYGHSRLREMILGGATREVLDHVSLPVLMAH